MEAAVSKGGMVVEEDSLDKSDLPSISSRTVEEVLVSTRRELM